MNQNEKLKQKWKKELSELQFLLEGKRIMKVERTRPQKQNKSKNLCDDDPVFIITLNNGERIKIAADYGGYTGFSIDEYPKLIKINKI